ncbi:PspA [Corallococcus sp. AB018]|uniref:PspA n=1 Tax=Corallococcus sp. AB018 TaxID=2316715 RepID=UPI000F883962|nr:PspA [Corallococcus sp. AB018]RUO88960.1 PspA [Corallococcus sp. AB018]
MQNDMRSTIQAAVAEEVGKTLGRQLELLEQIAQYLGIAPGRTPAASVPKRAPVPPAAPKRTPSVPVRKWVKPQAASNPTRAGPAPQKLRGRGRGRVRAAGRTATATTPSLSPEASASYAAGQEVRYKQGRGTFSAKVKAVDEKAKTVTVARVSDGKEVVRPFDKVTPV